MKPIGYAGVLALLALAGCDPLPVAYGAPANLYTYPLPACLVFCTAHVSAIREDVNSVGAGSVATGSKSATQSSATNGQ